MKQRSSINIGWTHATSAFFVVVALSCAALAADADSQPSANKPSHNWTSYNGNGYAPLREGIKLFDSPDQIRLAWQNDEHTGIGKGGPGAMRNIDALGGKGCYGGTGSLIVADGVVYATYFRPTGDVRNEVSHNRYFKLPPSELPEGVRQIDADDVTLAIDADTGKTLWRAEELGKGLNFMPGKRGLYGVTPTWHDGKVYVFGATGFIYAYDGRTGKKLWESNNGAWHLQAEAMKKQSLEKKQIPDLYNENKGSTALPFQFRQTGMLVADGVLIVPTMGGVAGFDLANGKELWRVDKVQSFRTTPVVWTHDSREYLICTDFDVHKVSGSVTAIDPKNGKVLWKLNDVGPQRHQPVLGEGHMLVNSGRGTKGEDPDNLKGCTAACPQCNPC